MGERQDIEFIQSNGDKFHNKCVVFQQDNRLVGYILYHMDGDAIFVSYLGTHEDYRGRKIASKLLQWIQTDGGSSDPRTMNSVAFFKAPALVDFYQRRGFTKDISDDKIRMSHRG